MLFAAALNGQGSETQEVPRRIGLRAPGRRRRSWDMGDPPVGAPTSGSSNLPPRAPEATAAGGRSK